MRPELQEHGPDLAQVIVDDRLAAIEPQRLDLLPDSHPRQLRVVLQQPVDLVLERVELRRPLRTLERRRQIRPQRPLDRVPRQPRPAHQLLDRHPAHEMLPPQLRPPLHVKHASSWPSINTNEARLTITPDASATIPGGQISTGEGGSVSHRRRQRGAPLDEASTRVQAIHPSGFPLACDRPDGTGRPWAYPSGFAPRRPGADDARRGGDRPSSTNLELLDQHHIGLILQSRSSLTACDLVSHIEIRQSRGQSTRDRRSR